MVNKRYTYHFVLFVRGAYSCQDIAEIRRLLNHMTVTEKNIIASLDFEKIWYYFTLSNVRDSAYPDMRDKFANTFLRDRGAALIELINSSTSIGTLWEIPKGRKNAGESDIVAALREFGEETGISKKHYRVFCDSNKVVSRIDEGVRYTTNYHFALMLTDVEAAVKMSNDLQTEEILEVGWFGLGEVRSRFPEYYELARSAVNYVSRR